MAKRRTPKAERRYKPSACAGRNLARAIGGTIQPSRAVRERKVGTNSHETPIFTPNLGTFDYWLFPFDGPERFRPEARERQH